jgi:hypothetical protein
MKEKSMANELTNVGAIKRFFKIPGTRADMEYKEVNLQELQAIPTKDREELGVLAAAALGMSIGQALA